MFGSDVLDVAIGLILLFLMASLICSAVVEMIEGFLKARAMHMERGLRELLQDPDGELAEKLFKHPLVYNLFRGSYSAQNLNPTRGGGKQMGIAARANLPSYIPAANFARAVMDFAGRGEDADMGYHSPLTVAQLRYRLSNVSHPGLRRALSSALDGAGDDLAQVQKNLEAWFDSTMDRVSGWYKRRSSYLLFFIGLAAAVVLNLDPISIGSRLAQDDALRERFVAEAQLVAASTQAPVGGQQGAAAPLPDGADPNLRAIAAAGRQQIGEVRAQLVELGTPMGWRNWRPVQHCASRPSPKAACTGGASYVQIVIGWVIMAFAVTLGAPFWFDLLNRFMIVRSTVKPHEKSPEEPPIDAEKNRDGRGPAATPASAVAATSGAGAGATHGSAPERTESPPLPPDEDLDAPFEEPKRIPETEEVLI